MDLKTIGLWLFIFLGWNAAGFLLLGLVALCNQEGMLWNAEFVDFVNPCFVYKEKKVNWFGAIMISLSISLLCPMMLIVYWFYKLYTVGRR